MVKALLEAQRLEQRTKYDLEMLAGGLPQRVENYARHLAGRRRAPHRSA